MKCATILALALSIHSVEGAACPDEVATLAVAEECVCAGSADAADKCAAGKFCDKSKADGAKCVDAPVKACADDTGKVKIIDGTKDCNCKLSSNAADLCKVDTFCL